MKHIHFDVDKDGFYGAYWTCKNGSDCAIITMLGDDPEDYVARSAVKWILTWSECDYHVSRKKGLRTPQLSA